MLVADLLTAGAYVRAYDPMDMPNTRDLLPTRLDPADLDRLTLAGADVLALATE